MPAAHHQTFRPFRGADPVGLAFAFFFNVAAGRAPMPPVARRAGAGATWRTPSTSAHTTSPIVACLAGRTVAGGRGIAATWAGGGCCGAAAGRAGATFGAAGTSGAQAIPLFGVDPGLMNEVSACAASIGVWKRRAGSFAIILATTTDSSGGDSARSWWRGAASVDSCACRTA